MAVKTWLTDYKPDFLWDYFEASVNKVWPKCHQNHIFRVKAEKNLKQVYANHTTAAAPHSLNMFFFFLTKTLCSSTSVCLYVNTNTDLLGWRETRRVGRAPLHEMSARQACSLSRAQQIRKSLFMLYFFPLAVLLAQRFLLRWKKTSSGGALEWLSGSSKGPELSAWGFYLLWRDSASSLSELGLSPPSKNEEEGRQGQARVILKSLLDIQWCRWGWVRLRPWASVTWTRTEDAGL